MWYILAAVWIRMERWRAVLSTLCDRRASVDRVSISLCIEEPAFVRGIVPLVDVGRQRQRQRQRAAPPPHRARSFRTFLCSSSRVVISVTVYCTVNMVWVIGMPLCGRGRGPGGTAPGRRRTLGRGEARSEVPRGGDLAGLLLICISCFLAIWGVGTVSQIEKKFCNRYVHLFVVADP